MLHSPDWYKMKMTAQSSRLKCWLQPWVCLTASLPGVMSLFLNGPLFAPSSHSALSVCIMQPLFCNLHQNEDSHCARATVLDQVIYKASSKQSKIHHLQIISLLTSHSIERVMDWKIVTQGWNVVGNICHLSWLTSSIMGRWWPGNVIFVKGRRLSVIWSRGVNYAPQGSELSAPSVWRIIHKDLHKWEGAFLILLLASFYFCLWQIFLMTYFLLAC